MNKIQTSQIVSRKMTSARFRTGLSRLISKLSLIRSLKLLVSEAKTSKMVKISCAITLQ